MDSQIQFSRFSESDEAGRQKQHERETRPQAEKERAPTFYQRSREREGMSEWSGGSMGGGTWAGRSR
jgi:hypothetical protein